MAVNTNRLLKALRFTTHFILDDATDQVIPRVDAGSVIGNAISSIKWNNIPQVQTNANYNVTAADVGKHILSNAGLVRIATGIFVAGDVFVVVNNQGVNISLVANSGVTLYWPNGTAAPGTGSRTLAPLGVASVLCIGTNVFIVTGQGVL